MATKISNYFQSIPNDDDLDQVYYWERKSLFEKQEYELQTKYKVSKNNLVLRQLWFGEVQLKHQSVWLGAYLVLQGRRIIWWNKEEDVEDGKPPVGQLLLFGHTGITQASPVDVREVSGDDSRLLTVFGNSPLSLPIRCTIFCKDANSCKLLQKEIDLILKQNVR